jgi:hypothetical protein
MSTTELTNNLIEAQNQLNLLFDVLSRDLDFLEKKPKVPRITIDIKSKQIAIVLICQDKIGLCLDCLNEIDQQQNYNAQVKFKLEALILLHNINANYINAFMQKSVPQIKLIMQQAFNEGWRQKVIPQTQKPKQKNNYYSFNSQLNQFQIKDAKTNNIKTANKPTFTINQLKALACQQNQKKNL